MISRTLYIFSAGLKQLQLNIHFLLVAILLIVLPAIFIWFAQSFFDSAYKNINTSEKQVVSLLHDSISSTLEVFIDREFIQANLVNLVEKSTNITKTKILKSNGNELIVVYSSNGDEIGLEEGGSQLYTTSATSPGESLIFDFSIDGTRVWQAFRQVKVSDEVYYIFTEHSFAEIDSVMLARQQQVYLALPLIFIFLILLAYWLVKQTQWQKLYTNTKQKLDDQMLFTNTIAHELRAPLTAVKGYISFLKESDSLSADEKKYVKNISLSTERLLALINDFLEVARIQSGKLKITFKKVDIKPTILAVKEEFKQVAEAKNLDLNVSLPAKAIVADTDAQRLHQILANLVSNALKYTEKGAITISLEQTRLKTIIAIKDTGHGISAEDQQKLFGIFTRVGKADKNGVTGTGLGMWITKQLAELLHGRITIESIEGIGTHAKLTFDV